MLYVFAELDAAKSTGKKAKSAAEKAEDALVPEPEPEEEYVDWGWYGYGWYWW